jgi:hypothetical protein
MNGYAVEQTIAMQQIFEISRNGVFAHKPCECKRLPHSMKAAHDARHHYRHRHHAKWAIKARKVRSWLKRQPPAFRIFFSLLIGTLSVLFIIVVVRIIASIFVYARGYKRVSDVPATVVFIPNQKSHSLVISDVDSRVPPEYEHIEQ